MNPARISTRFIILVLAACAMLASAASAQAQKFDNSWTFSINGQQVTPDAAGNFLIRNISAPDLFGPGGPGTAPDFLADDYSRVIGVDTSTGTNRHVFSEFIRIGAGKASPLRTFTFTNTPPRKPDMLAAAPDVATLTALGQTTQVRVTATYPDKTTGDVTPATNWTSYRTSNLAVARVDADGLVTATGQGIAYITAVNEGTTAVTQINVVPGDPLTTVKGFMRLQDGTPAAGVTVSISGLGLTAVVQTDGSFTFTNVPTTLGPLTLSTVVVQGSSRLVAVAKNLRPIAGGAVDAGILTLAPYSENAQIKAIAAGGFHTVALKIDGSLWAWGANGAGQVGDGTSGNSKVSPVRVGTDNDWVEVVAGYAHTVALKSGGSLWAWGYNFRGALGDGTTADKFSPVRVGTGNDWVQIAAGDYHTVALKSDGTFWAWGANFYGQLGDGTTVDKLSPVRIGTDSNWAQIAAGQYHTVARKTDSTLWAWGDNTLGRLGDGTVTQRIAPVQIGSGTDWAQVDAGSGHTVALKNDGSLWAWGDNRSGQLGDGTTGQKLLPVRIGTANDWTQIATGGQHTTAIKTDGSLWAWGANSNGQLHDETHVDRLTPVQIGTAGDWARITAGLGHTVALKFDGSLLAWGSNVFGQLGDGKVGHYEPAPMRIGTGADWQQIAASVHTLASKTDGSLWAWGANVQSQLGIGTSGDQLKPVRVGTANDWARIAAGNVHSAARKTDGSLWAWGDNDYGQLGDGTTVDKPSPVRIGTDNDWDQISVGDRHTVALKTDGSLWAWGWNAYGQLGDGTTANKLNPVRIGNDNDWTQIAAGAGYHTLARKSDGSLWSWGYNGFGQLGDGTVVSKLLPVRIGTENDWAQIAAGGWQVYGYSLGIKSDGSLWGWGSNATGQLGNGTIGTRLLPVRSGTANDWAKLAPGITHTVARKIDGSLWAWGDNEFGQLGVDYNDTAIGGTYDWGLPVGASVPALPAAVVTALPTSINTSPSSSTSTPSTSASALRLTDIARTPAGAGFQFATEAGRQYRLEGTEDLASGQWTILLDHIPGTGGVLQVTDRMSLA
jgi:alpha-tubulin suppressor-like RCC1 family protein